VRTALNIAILSFDNPDSACARYRIHTPLNQDGVNVLWAVTEQGDQHSIDGGMLHKADIIIVQRFFPRPATQPILDQCFASGKPVIYDTDDLMSAVPKENKHAPTAWQTMETLASLGDKFTLITASTQVLANDLKKLTPRVIVAPNRLDTSLWQNPTPTRPSAPVRLLYAGTDTHVEDLLSIEAPLLRALEAHGEAVNLTLFGCSTSTLKDHPKTHWVEQMDSYAAYAEKIQSMEFDIAIAPLTNNPFNRAKSHVKWLEYSACGMAGIYSDLPPYDCIKNGVTGYLASSPGEWLTCLNDLIRHPDKRTKIAKQSWEAVQAESLNGKMTPLLSICYKLTGKKPAS